MMRSLLCTMVGVAGVLTAANLALRPRLFGEGAISTPADETGFALTPDGKTAFFSVRSGQTASPTVDVLCVSRLRNGRWTEPEVAPFSGRYRDVGPAVSPDGAKLFFGSNRPMETGDRRDFNLWYIDLAGDWKTPHPVPGAVNSPGQEFGVSVATNGTLYFASNRPGGKGAYDLYRSRLVNGSYAEPENLGPPINTEGFELAPAVSPDERILVFEGLGRSDEITGVHREYNKGDLYVSRFENGSWTAPCNAGPAVNSGAGESAPFFTADGKSLFFVSERGFATLRPPRALDYRTIDSLLSKTLNGMGNVFEIAATALDGARCPQ
ncbi:MAG TPA: hypothetical protein VKU19_29925 [Bryobacteraceae bacterium]|nr:hypothetical protein [Bryobacteraceae bacterium]